VAVGRPESAVFGDRDCRRHLGIETAALQFQITNAVVERCVGHLRQALEELVEHAVVLVERQFDINAMTRDDARDRVRALPCP